MTAVWSVFLLCGLLHCLLSRVLCGLVRWCCAVVIALLFQVSKLVFECVVLEAVRVVHVISWKYVVQRGAAVPPESLLILHHTQIYKICGHEL